MFNSFFKRSEEEEQMRAEGRLPPGLSLTQKFPVLHYGPVPRFNPAAWNLHAWGEVENEVCWTWDEFNLATHLNGEPISPDQGYPLRGVVGAIPGREDLMVPYLWKGTKWLRGLEFLAHDQPGFWEQAGYHNEADVWKEGRFG